MKRKILNLFLCASLLLSCACTKFLWGDPHYKEEIHKFLVGADGRYVALIGDQYHYVFSDNSGMLKKILSLNQKGVLTIDHQKTHFKLKKNNNVGGDFVIEGPFSILNFHDQTTLLNLGVRPDRDDNVVIKIPLTGKRYLSKYLGHNEVSDTGSVYAIDVYYKRRSSLMTNAGKAAVTPIAVTVDATLFIGKVLLIYPFSL